MEPGVKLTVRVLASLAIAVASVWATYRFCYLRHACNLRAESVQQSMVRVMRAADQATARIVARKAIDEMNRCLECWSTNMNFYMIRAAALRMLDRPAEAALDYRRALRIDRRAELYFNLGLTELEAGREAQAADALTTAVFLFYPYVDEIPDPMQTRIRSTVTPTVELMQNHAAPPAVIEELHRRVARDPL